jgi:hydroxypyruvate isomerase
VPRFAANLGFLFPERPFLERFAAAAQAGFRAVEFADPYAQPGELARLLDAHALECALFNLPMGDRARGDRGIACLPDRVDEFRAGVALAVDAARALRCPRVNCIAGVRPPGADGDVLRATLVANLRFAARAFAGAGLTLCLEAINERDVPGFFLCSAALAVEVIGEVGADNLRLQFDCYHMQIIEGDPAASLDRLFPLVGHVQFADAPGRHEPGTGTIPYDRLFAQLDGLGYRGWVGAEYHPSKKRTEDTLGWLR